MKLRILKVISKPKAAIGVSLLDVISNALASIILLFFVFAALRGQPKPPDRVLGILIIDYKINSVVDTPAISIYVRAPSLIQKDGQPLELFDTSIEEELPTVGLDTIKGVWENAIILTTPGQETKTRRLVYMNPQEGTWFAGMIFTDHSRYTSNDYLTKHKGNSFEMKAYFVNPEGTKMVQLKDINSGKISEIEFPTQKAEMDSFRISNYNF